MVAGEARTRVNGSPPSGFCVLVADRSNLDSIEALQAQLQTALALEFFTIPPYLTAMYSIKDATSDAYQVIRSVAVEEMSHLNLVANLLIAIGGRPNFIDAAPSYPNYMPKHASGGPYVSLARLSKAVLEQVFMAIELPAPESAPPEEANYQTIGQFYELIGNRFSACQAAHGARLFAKGGVQRTHYGIGAGGGRPIEVNGLSNALKAIAEIVEQGEGSPNNEHTFVPMEKWGELRHYGYRTDGTYGPILGTPYAFSHYFKFKNIAESSKQFPDVYPMIDNPTSEKFGWDLPKEIAELFDSGYSVFLKALQTAFSNELGAAPDPYFSVALPMMHTVLPRLAASLVTIPVYPDGDPSVGPNAGPTWQYRENANLKTIIEKADVLIGKYRLPAYTDVSLLQLVDTLNGIVRSLRDMHDQLAAHAELSALVHGK